MTDGECDIFRIKDADRSEVQGQNDEEVASLKTIKQFNS